ncbi:aldo/keto reductase [Mesorhizobium sp.]|uniref:aldo/keto reductase n=1 Tax=Mesorhizobium sp. TaxID=1871066 RepID=UPI000FE79C57|nr:aldo/keto reductase [Mesorhizobium sp.]RWD71755.1 MAG: aldo/keto reductase [Mesorhizobium sp.]TIV61775.1 MAG: aldo/keto reductase [Mesorhizobium sp.]
MKTRHFDRIGNGGITFTELGFGTAPLGNLYRAISDEDANATLEAAWKAGCRYFDTAPLYGLGLSETRLNPFLRGRKRDDYVLSSKVGRLMRVAPPDQRTGIGKFFETPSRREVYDYSYDGVMRSFEASLERLGVDRIDILFVHDVDIFTHGSKEASDARIAEFMSSGYYGLLSLRDQGVIKAFGGGINEWQVAQTLAERGDFDLFLLAGRYTLLEQEALQSFLPLCQKRGIGIVLGGPYNSGVLATGPKPGAFYNYSEAPKEILDRVARIEAVCKRRNVRLIEAALQFPLQHPSVMSVIPGGQRPAEVESNRALLDTKIPAALWADLKQEGLMRADAPTA